MSKSTDNTNKRYAGFKYIQERETYNNSIGDFRCDNQVNREPKCKIQCEKCNSYYFEKIIEK